jgi:TetR/AcrR family transcriptional regulator, transcriptional repressor for nem operon
MMARPREFDLDEAVEKARDVFWRQGYHATSITDLTDALGILRGSLYKAFPDKHSLFLAALDVYRADAIEAITSILARPGSQIANIRTILLYVADDAAGEAGKRGCLIANMALELLPNDLEVAARITSHYRLMEELIQSTIERAQVAGEVSKEQDARALAQLVVTAIQGMRVVGKTSPTRSRTRAMVETLLGLMR